MCTFKSAFAAFFVFWQFCELCRPCTKSLRTIYSSCTSFWMFSLSVYLSRCALVISMSRPPISDEGIGQSINQLQIFLWLAPCHEGVNRRRRLMAVSGMTCRRSWRGVFSEQFWMCQRCQNRGWKQVYCVFSVVPPAVRASVRCPLTLISCDAMSRYLLLSS